MLDYENKILEEEYESTGISMNYGKTSKEKRNDLFQKTAHYLFFDVRRATAVCQQRMFVTKMPIPDVS
jgi:hypothetical protein